MSHKIDLFHIVQQASEWSEISTCVISGFQSSLAHLKNVIYAVKYFFIKKENFEKNNFEKKNVIIDNNLLVTDDLSTELLLLVVEATFIACSKNATRSK